MWFEPSIPKKEGHVVSFRQKPVEVACIIDGTDAVRGRGGPGLIPGLYEKVSFASVLIFCNPRGPTFAGITNMIAVFREDFCKYPEFFRKKRPVIGRRFQLPGISPGKAIGRAAWWERVVR